MKLKTGQRLPLVANRASTGAAKGCSRRREEADRLLKFAQHSASSPRRLPRLRAFTLVEVLAALAFMAIVIPVAVDGLRVASLAGQVGERKATASRIAERILNELLVTGQYRSATQKGVVQEDAREYRWSMRSESWPLGAMRLVTVEVIYPVQGRDYDVRLSTLADNSTQ